MEEGVYKKISDERLLQVEYWKRKCADGQTALTAEVLRAARHLLKHYAPAARDEAARAEWLDAREALRRLGVAEELAAVLAQVESGIWQEQPAARAEEEGRERAVTRLEAVVATLDGLARVCEAAKSLERLGAFARELEELRRQGADCERRAAELLGGEGGAERLMLGHLAQLSGFNDLLLAQAAVQRETLAGLFAAHPPTLLRAVRAELAQLRRGSVAGPARQAVKEELEAAHFRLLRTEHDKRELVCLNNKLKAYNDQLFAQLLDAPQA